MYDKKRSFDRNRPRPQRNFQRQDRPKRYNPLPEGFSLFYISILCPNPIEEKVKGYKNYMEEKYGCRAASKSPAHITIVPPFRAEDELLPTLQDFVSTFNIGIVPFDISLNGYGQFGDRVLYVDIEPNESLKQLESECAEEFNQKFPGIIFRTKPDFNPHVTIATRDIPEGKIQEARMYFESNHPIAESFNATTLSLMKLDNGWWKEA